MKRPVQGSEMLMLGTAGLTFALVARGWAGLCLALCLIALSSWFIPWRYSLSQKGQKVLQGLAGLPFLLIGGYYVKTQSHPVELAMRVAVLGAVYVLVKVVLELYRESDLPHTRTFHFSCLVLMVVGGLSLENPYYPLCLAVYAGAAVLFLRRPFPQVAKGSKSSSWLVGIFFALALFLAHHLTAYVPHLRRLAWKTQASVLSGEGAAKDRLFGVGSSLWSVENLSNSRELVARVFGPSTVLRGRVGAFYRDGRWLAGIPAYDEWEELSPHKILRLHGTEPTRSQKWRICPVRPLDGPLPLPAGVYRLEAEVDAYRIGPFDQIEGRVRDCYTAFASEVLGQGRSPKRPLRGSWRWPGYLDTPPPMQPVLDSVGREILGDLKEPEQMAQAMETYLSEAGLYGPYDWGQGGEPLKNFLTKEMKGTSEFYATAMALMLRRKGVPTRYVSGYQVVEQNTWGGYFMVRDRDARAWVEVALEGRGWVPFNPTPKSASLMTHPEGYDSSGMAAFLDNLRVQGGRFRKWLVGRDWKRTAGFLLGLLLLSGLVTHLLRRRSDIPVSASELKRARLERLFRRACKDLAYSGLVREHWETPLELARRASQFEPMSQWLQDYSRSRFGGANEEQIRELESSLQQAVKSLQK